MKRTLTVIFALMNAAASTATAQNFEEGVDFRFGDRCEKLDDLSLDGVVALIVGADDRARASFCTIAEPEDCGDFSRALQEFGALVPADRADTCRFAPHPVQHRVQILAPRNVW